jgi:hypothetical protein
MTQLFLYNASQTAYEVHNIHRSDAMTDTKVGLPLQLRKVLFTDVQSYYPSVQWKQQGSAYWVETLKY